MVEFNAVYNIMTWQLAKLETTEATGSLIRRRINDTSGVTMTSMKTSYALYIVQPP